MTLQKNLLGLVFFFMLSATQAQLNPLALYNETYDEYAFVESANEYENITTDVAIPAALSEDLKEVKIYDFLEGRSVSVGKATENFIVESLPFNSNTSDYAPSFYKGELVFASSRNSKSFTVILQENTNEPFLDLYTTNKNIANKGVSKLKGAINTKFHESSATFSPDGKTVYFTRNNYANRKFKRNTKGCVLLKIYKADYVNGKWKNVAELPFNSDEYSTAHPALSPDGKFLYFASDMPGSNGKSDIYVVAVHEDGSYGKPQNLGSLINSAGRETFPFVSDKGTLFFTSDGHLGFGGLDIFMVLPDDHTGWEVYNMGVPINSPEDDFTFIINEEYHMGYFASNRSGGKGGDDIYGFKQLTALQEYRNHMPEIKRKIKRHLDIKPATEEVTSF
ncbi:TolB family protein [Aquimarina sp. SS2-1]|uniref:TolB family protein n=1 Tax=Aquimarina besae TaxID=3342247 RepID=UPI00366D531A